MIRSSSYILYVFHSKSSLKYVLWRNFIPIFQPIWWFILWTQVLLLLKGIDFEGTRRSIYLVFNILKTRGALWKLIARLMLSLLRSNSVINTNSHYFKLGIQVLLARTIKRRLNKLCILVISGSVSFIRFRESTLASLIPYLLLFHLKFRLEIHFNCLI